MTDPNEQEAEVQPQVEVQEYLTDVDCGDEHIDRIVVTENFV